MQCESYWHFQYYLKAVGTFSIILSTVHMNVRVIEHVKMFCMHMHVVLIFPLA